jgi:hypothetical protein
MKIQKNIGAVDRAVRIAAGIVSLCLVSLAFVGPESRWALLGLLGAIPLVAGVVGYCPPYALLGIDTCKDDEGRCEQTDEVDPERACC